MQRHGRQGVVSEDPRYHPQVALMHCHVLLPLLHQVPCVEKQHAQLPLLQLRGFAGQLLLCEHLVDVTIQTGLDVREPAYCPLAHPLAKGHTHILAGRQFKDARDLHLMFRLLHPEIPVDLLLGLQVKRWGQHHHHLAHLLLSWFLAHCVEPRKSKVPLLVELSYRQHDTEQ